MDADGSAGGAGKLVGAILAHYKLSDPIELGAFGSFSAAADGELVLRCRDNWNELADNKGKISVRLKLKGKGTPLPAPQNDPEKSDPDKK